MEDRDKLAFEYARDTTKQLIALSAGVIALTVTFSKDFLGGVDTSLKPLVILSWLAFLSSVVAGQWALMALTGSAAKHESGKSAIYGPNVKIPSVTQVLLFLTGMVLTVLVAACSI